MKLWVYIYEDEIDDFKIGLSAVVGQLTSSILQKVRFVYLRPFDVPFDALAHKNLLDTLSKKTIADWVHKHKEETKLWISIINKNEKVK